MLLPILSQDVGANMHLQQDLSTFDLFSSMAKSGEHGRQEQGESSDTMDVVT